MEEVQCLMADDTEEVFDFSNLEFTRKDLVTALNEMVQEYKKLFQSFEEVKAEKESCATKAELVSSRDMQAARSKLATENEELRSRFDVVNKLNEVQRGVASQDSKVASMDSNVVSLDLKVDKLMDIQTFMKHDSGPSGNPSGQSGAIAGRSPF
ncbi:hypothetical protein F511_28058 [Dorcoceras hygrometricum]|uniref:Uncharacterized protein n=1 Tax=Dorcoceras hygrometricum TaxID=472368 RepID=A0A2Z7AI23_9LAMI|nr:hypothetical protein F511_28058 [Dorcoceras hygrometricum]